MNIEILSAKNGHQIAMIDGKKYQFDFSEYDFANDLFLSKSIHDLSIESGLNTDDYTSFEMAEVVAEKWDFDLVEDLIQSCIDYGSEKLEDHLISE